MSPNKEFIQSITATAHKIIDKLCFFAQHKTVDIFQAYADKIIQETELSRDHLTPELNLHLITQSCRLWKAQPEDSPFPEPFWAFYWPGGQAVARYVLDSPYLVKGKRVLDFGCGCGASGLAALKSKAKMVMFNDIDEENLIGSSCEEYDVLLVGDMLYGTDFADEVLLWLDNIRKRDKLVLIGDPGRFALASHPLKADLRCFAKYHLSKTTTLENNGYSQACVWSFL
ncbi:electron transfer flavoprotein beta subunit lysine methyltransferase-like [Penaeus monodon]|uniref:electron transfer flavoprotein beta subunit lysine methyltransferase-like n=1 Tax=Penaeus monodon TaxID=6687 RepID=UPI0018A75CA8|nr:electron transfer flavoprotein beta subunit lysine methyltransferase-like [Penaeus monodon]